MRCQLGTRTGGQNTFRKMIERRMKETLILPLHKSTVFLWNRLEEVQNKSKWRIAPSRFLSLGWGKWLRGECRTGVQSTCDIGESLVTFKNWCQVQAQDSFLQSSSIVELFTTTLCGSWMLCGFKKGLRKLVREKSVIRNWSRFQYLDQDISGLWY